MTGKLHVSNTSGQFWVNDANTPLRYARAKSYGRGIHVTLVACWPNCIFKNKCSINDPLGHVVDLMATIIELTQTSYLLSDNRRELNDL
ncbi:MAG: hypothetical protein WCG82_03225 [Bacteroidota bacterium]